MQGDTSLQTFAGEIEIQQLVLEGCERTVDLTSIDGPVQQVLIYQNLFRPTLSAEIKIADGRSLTELGPIVGLERFYIKFKVPQEREVANLIFRVINVHDRKPAQGAQQAQLYTLDLVSEERLMNAYQRVSKAYEGTVSKIVEKVFDEYITTGKHSKSLHHFLAEETQGNIHYVAPNIHPFDIITNVSQYAISPDNKSCIYLFFENFNSFHYRSLHSLFEQPIINSEPYTYQLKDVINRSDVKKHMSIMEGILINNSFPNSLSGLENGFYSGSLYTHDIYTKKINNGSSKGLTEYDYLKEFNNVPHTDDRGYEVIPIGGLNAYGDAIKLSRFEEAKKSHIEVYSKHNSMYESSEFKELEQSVLSAPNFDVEDIALHRTSQQQQMESISLSTRVAGNPNLNVGACIDLEIQSFLPSDDFVINEILSGKYLISEAVHHFSHNNYMCDLTLLKDSSGVSIDSAQIQPFEVAGGQYENP